ncbi:MAG: hypothetical protein ACTS2F_22525 [Thainema sp.]
MFNDELNQLNPTTSEVESVLELNQIAHEFRQEVEYRDAFRQHCHWYHTTAQQHQLELVQMRSELNLFEWFCRFMRFK